MSSFSVSELISLLAALAMLGYISYLFLKKTQEEQRQNQVASIQAEQYKNTLSIKIQAYERICLFLERISPNNLLVRLYGTAASVSEFQQVLLAEIREEFTHNLVQQLYISPKAWELTKQAMNETVATINTAASQLSPNDASNQLSRKIFDKVLEQDPSPTDIALRFLKEEFQQKF